MNILIVGGREGVGIGIQLAEAGHGYEHNPTELLATRTLREREIDLVILGGDVETTGEIDQLAERLKVAALGGPRGLPPHVFVVCDQEMGSKKEENAGSSRSTFSWEDFP